MDTLIAMKKNYTKRHRDFFLVKGKEKSDLNTKTKHKQLSQFQGMKWLVQKLTQWETMKRNHWIDVFPFSHFFILYFCLYLRVSVSRGPLYYFECSRKLEFCFIRKKEKKIWELRQNFKA